ncbi:unnamed protein product (macronuclear) [Paramecium tetraurelia]|uniref:Inhibitor of apoptosis-promoting Bax1 protein n=1 Tax=Paramecium tetraurelia TaxID=5888 RepID=A0BK98_PARTE|nr:uncharacterized protein GSPATT00029595001 [Paramecium tetraurelia]CAK58965.1 unnamed protein product [Paramecium tetraurelia]|eukprot:XP_001426363.1 hypothetical protein (macronuclear) [Paramecium tetraurelia strain d4-2]
MQNSQQQVNMPQSRMIGDPAQSQYLQNSMAQDPQFLSYQNYRNEIQEEGEIVAETAKLRKLYFLMLLQFFLVIVFSYVSPLLNPTQLRLDSLEDYFEQNSYWIIILSLGCFLLSLAAYFTNPENTAVNVVLYVLFTIVLYFFFISLTAITNIEQSMMVAFMIFGQIFSQFLSVMQSRIEMYYHQQSLYVLAGGLIIFQLFIIYSIIPFFEMIITLVSGVVFGFLLIYSTQSNLSQIKSGAVNGSVRVYVDLLGVFFYLNQLMADLFRKEKQIDK